MIHYKVSRLIITSEVFDHL